MFVPVRLSLPSGNPGHSADPRRQYCRSIGAHL